MEPHAFIFFGKSGSGKGTQARLLLQYLEEHDTRKVLYIETGARFREFMEGGSPASAKVKEIIGQGGLVPVFIPIWMWASTLVHEVSGQEHLVFDGVARRVDAAPILDSAFEFYGYTHVHIFHINVSDERATEMMKGRGREDDTDEKIAERLAWYRRDVMPSVEYFKNHEGYHFADINGEQSIEAVHASIVSAAGLSE